VNSLPLFVACTLIWGTTWYAITLQLAAVAPEFGVAWRFALAALLILAWCMLRRLPWHFTRREHAWFAALGALNYSFAYILIYHAERFVVSGLVAVGYSAMPLLNMLAARWLFGTPMSRRVAVGGALGVSGVALVFWPEFAHLDASRDVALGAVFTVVAVLLSCAGNMIVASQQRRSVTGWAPIGFSMAYGAAAAFVIAVALGRPATIAWSVDFAVSLLYLALAGSVLAFGSYFALLARVGPARAAYVGVMTPVVALVVSTIWEQFTWQAATLAGVALAIAGNVLALHQPARRPAAAAAR
jgi:drug/metabolite transporter (DMT)-like permease